MIPKQRTTPKAGRAKRKPEISPTKIRIFLACALMYKFTYVTRIGKFHYVPNVGDSFGSSLHRALHDFHAAGGHETHSPEQLVERLQNTWVRTGYSSPEEETAHLDLGARMLEGYYATSQTGSVTLLTERQIREDLGDFILTGRLDRLDERPDGTLEIVDYKSGRSCVTSEQVAQDLAMSIYQFLVKGKYPDRRVIATIHCLRTGENASAELSDQELVELREHILGIAPDMLAITEDTEIDPVRRPDCDRCDFSRICEKRARILGLEWRPK